MTEQSIAPPEGCSEQSDVVEELPNNEPFILNANSVKGEMEIQASSTAPSNLFHGRSDAFTWAISNKD